MTNHKFQAIVDFTAYRESIVAEMRETVAMYVDGRLPVNAAAIERLGYIAGAADGLAFLNDVLNSVKAGKRTKTEAVESVKSYSLLNIQNTPFTAAESVGASLIRSNTGAFWQEMYSMVHYA